MRLLRLEVKGFKSFANDTVLHFKEDVIGVVGPNGSGKSKVVDTIRWVLGEQKSKELRLEKMSDVIFNGTKKRKEAGMAQVTLVFENNKGLLPTDYNQVSISRLLYRSGDSEYRLNDVPCRLKDVQSLFLDTCIGSNSYAIIALGMVDDILADKENARRRMFEQAAGISKYKKRKKETLSKLKSTSADLDRVEDLLYEIEGQLKSLERQAKRTKKYFELKEQYKELAVQLSLHTVIAHKERYKDIEGKLKEQQDKYRRLETDITSREAAIQKAKSDNLEVEERLSAQQRQLAQMVSDIQTLQGEKALLTQQIGFYNQNQDKTKQQIAQARQDLGDTDRKISYGVQRIAEETQKLQQLELDKETADQSYQSAKQAYQQAKDLSDQLAKELADLDRQLYTLEKDVAVLRNTVDSQQQRKEQIIEQREQRQQQHETIASSVDQLTTERDHYEQSLNTLTSEMQQREQTIEDLSDSLVQHRQTFDEVSRSLDKTTNEYSLLKSMVDSMEGFPESVKFLAKKWDGNVPILSDILDVNEAYKAPIEQFLEPYLNHYVVPDVAKAVEAIRMLTASQAGKAHFFLLDQIPPTEATDIVIANSVPAHSLVDCESQYQPLVNYLLHNTYILDGSLDDFKYLDTYQSCNFLSTTGSFIKTKGAISGGSVGLFQGKKIGRKKNLDRLTKRIQQLEKDRTDAMGKVSALEDQLQRLRSQNAKQELRDLQQQRDRLDKELLKLKIKSDDYSTYQQQTEVQLAAIAERIDAASVQEEGLLTQISAITQARTTKLQSPGKAEGQVDTLAETMNAASAEYNASNVALIRHNSLLDTLQKDHEYEQRKQQDLQQRIEDFTQQLAANEAATVKKQEQLQTTESRLLELYDKRKNDDVALSEAEQAFFRARNSISTLETELQQVQRQRNQLQALVQQLRDDFTSVKFQINAVGDRLKIEFDIVLNDIINDDPDPAYSQDDLSQKVEKLRTRLGNYGEINPLALEAYEEMKLRYDDITTQRDDITAAKASLIETIKEIEETATNKFMEAFEQVRVNFIDVFRSLFTEEDTCNLILLDPESPLESKIDIVAKPKGKKPVSLSQLSGGEKTLTATALLFALYLLKPAPFCIFDEVDAPLDDANIQKFNKIIKKFSKDSQFIIVTHNKSTMAAVDVLYGVYMQEQGVSGVSAVDFRNYDHQELLEKVG